jgi:hypothetical protein
MRDLSGRNWNLVIAFVFVDHHRAREGAARAVGMP